jgi:hypothetical protein
MSKEELIDNLNEADNYIKNMEEMLQLLIKSHRDLLIKAEEVSNNIIEANEVISTLNITRNDIKQILNEKYNYNINEQKEEE